MDWDVALSYAGAQRPYVARVAEVLTAHGLKPFFDHEQRVDTWGTHLRSTLRQIFAEADVVVVFLSAEYLVGPWTTIELEIAEDRVAQGGGERVLLNRFDDTAPPRTLVSRCWMDLRDQSPEEFAELLVEKLKRLGIRSTGVDPRLPPPPRTFTGRTQLLGQIHDQLGRAGRVAVTALRGQGGVGKTQLAAEYARRHGADYQVVRWIRAENTAVLESDLADLARQLDLPVTGVPATDAAAAQDALARSGSWLLIFDNAEDLGVLRPWLPAGPGHVLITSRRRGWEELAACVDVDVLAPDEAVELLLSKQVPGLGPGLAAQLAAELGLLPLALGQAAAYLHKTGAAPQTYLARLRAKPATMLAKGQDPIHGDNVRNVWEQTLSQLEPAAVQLLQVCAQLGPDPIPLLLLDGDVAVLPAGLREVVAGADPMTDLDDLIGEVRDYSLISRDGDALLLHRLDAEVICDLQDPQLRADTADAARELLAAAVRTDPEDPVGWPVWAALAPHLIAAPALHADAETETVDRCPAARALLLDTCRYLNARGHHQQAEDTGRRIRQRWYDALGVDHADTLRASHALVTALSARHSYDEARRLGRGTLDRMRQQLGPDHPETLRLTVEAADVLRRRGAAAVARTMLRDTLDRQRRLHGVDDRLTLRTADAYAGSLYDVGDYAGALAVHEYTLARRRDRLGDNHADTLQSMHHLAVTLGALDEHVASQERHADTLQARRRTLGADHPDTLRSAAASAASLTRLADHRKASTLHEDTLQRRRRALGADHPETLQSANALAAGLIRLGELARARDLHADTFHRWQQLAGRAGGADHPELLRLAHGLAGTMSDLGDHEAALRLQEDVRRRRVQVLGGAHPDTLRSTKALATIRNRRGDRAGARKLFGEHDKKRKRYDNPSQGRPPFV